MLKIVITTTSFGEYNKESLRVLRKSGFKVKLNPYARKLNSHEIVALCKDAVGIIAGTENLDAKTLKRLGKLRVISRCGTGLDNIDLAAAKRLGIQVYNTPDAPTLAVAELTVGLILNLLRKVNQMDRALKVGEWEKIMGSMLSGKKVGIIGFGRIGRNVARLLKAFGCEIAYCDPFIKDSVMGLSRLSKEKLLSWAEIITLHASGKGRVLRKNELEMVKKGAFLVNVARGELVEENALYKALKRGDLSGAALDCFMQEPYRGPLKKLPNVILTPHIGSYAKEARVQMEKEAVGNLIKGLKKERLC